MNQEAILASVAIAISCGGVILGIINHKRLISKCNGIQIEASFDIDNTSPQTERRSSMLPPPPPIVVSPPLEIRIPEETSHV